MPSKIESQALNLKLLDPSKIRKAIIALGASVNKVDENGNTLLHSASYYGFDNLVRALLESPFIEPSLTKENKFGLTGLTTALTTGKSNIVEIFFETRPQEFTQVILHPKNQDNPLCSSIYHYIDCLSLGVHSKHATPQNYINIIKLLMSNYPRLVSLPGKNGSTPIEILTLRLRNLETNDTEKTIDGILDLIKILLHFQILDVNMSNNNTNDTLLHKCAATLTPQVKAAILLLESPKIGPSLITPNIHGKLPLDIACNRGNEMVVRALVIKHRELGAEFDYKVCNPQGYTPLLTAVRSYLHALKENSDSQNQNTKTYLTIINLLLDEYPHWVNQAEKQKNTTAIYYAIADMASENEIVVNAATSLVKLLLSKGASLTIASTTSGTAWDMAKRRRVDVKVAELEANVKTKFEAVKNSEQTLLGSNPVTKNKSKPSSTEAETRIPELSATKNNNSVNEVITITSVSKPQWLRVTKTKTKKNSNMKERASIEEHKNQFALLEEETTPDSMPPTEAKASAVLSLTPISQLISIDQLIENILGDKTISNKMAIIVQLEGMLPHDKMITNTQANKLSKLITNNLTFSPHMLIIRILRCSEGTLQITHPLQLAESISKIVDNRANRRVKAAIL